MQNQSATLPEPKTDAEYVVAVEKMIAEMNRMNGQMDTNRKEIDRLQAETRAILSDLGAAV